MKKANRSRLRLMTTLLAAALLVSLLPTGVSASEDAYQYGTVSYFSKVTNTFTLDSYYYTDAWLQGDLTAQNDALALISAQLSGAVTDETHGVDFLEELGFTGVSAVGYGDPNLGTGAYTTGVKTLDGGVTVVAVAFQGAEYGAKGWRQNVTVNTEDDKQPADHAALAQAARAFSDSCETDGVLYWITGQSRGGALANLAAADLLDKGASVVCYTFESPATTENSSAHDSKYQTIFNYVSNDDPVTMLPPWDMTRYGQEEIVYNTASIEEVQEALLRLNLAAYEWSQAYDASPLGDDVAAYAQNLIKMLVSIVPTRAAYTATQTDHLSVTDPTAAVSYCDQDGLDALCEILFFSGSADTGMLSPLLDFLPDLTYSALEETHVALYNPEDSAALLADAAQRRWATAGAFYALADEACSGHSFTREDLYALLRFLSKVLIDPEPLLEEDWVLPEYDEDFPYYLYADLMKLYGLIGNATTLMFSHHPDVILARLHLLAPAPAMDDVELTMTEPANGMAVSQNPAELRAAVTDLKLDWLTLEEAEWLTVDTLLNDSVYYLSVTISATGHSLPEDFRFTVNGRTPDEQTVSYQDGKPVITGVWRYEIGAPEQVAVRFDPRGHGDAPDAAEVDKGSILKYTDLVPADLGRVKDETGLWQFTEWTDASGAPWTEVTAADDVVLYANWLRVIDEIKLTYTIPHVGDSEDDLIRIELPDDAPFVLDNPHVINDNYDTLESIESTEPLHLIVILLPKEYDMLFLSELNEYDYPVFAGEITVNGEAVDEKEIFSEIPYDGVEYFYVYMSYTFTPLPKDEADPGPAEDVPSEAPAETVTCPFADVPENAYYRDAVLWAVEQGVTSGTDTTHFSPDKPCTRAEMVSFLWRAAGKPEPAGAANPFRDVPAGVWYAKAVLWAVEQGITCGVTPTAFDPDAICTRAQMAAFLWRFAGKPEPGAVTNPFADVSADSWYTKAVLWAKECGITAGFTPSTFEPASPCPRAQAIALLNRFFRTQGVN